MKRLIQIKRVYEKPLKKDGLRVLVDRLWPRGITKQDAAIDEWAKKLAPSTSLRKWYSHDAELWDAFKEKYEAELKENEEVDIFVTSHLRRKTITLIYSAKDEAHTHALILQHYLERQFHSR